MPNRIIKESIHESEDVNKMTDFQFRLWVNLIAYVDDYGRGDARPAIIKGKCFPLRDTLSYAEIEDALNALAEIGSISFYESDGKRYFFFPKWELHQRIRQKVSKFPDPLAATRGNSRQLAATRRNSPQIAAECGNSPQIAARIQSNTIQSESEVESESESESEVESNTNRRDVFSEFSAGDLELLQTLRDFEEMRKKIKKPMTDRAKSLLLSKLQGFKRSEWIPILNQSILNCWQGVFPLNRKNAETNNIFVQIAEEENG